MRFDVALGGLGAMHVQPKAARPSATPTAPIFPALSVMNPRRPRPP